MGGRGYKPDVASINMFETREESLMSEIFRLNDYLARIGVEGPLRADLATLTKLQAAHVAALPFEGLDPLLRRPVALDLAALQAKIVDGRRGGYCYEQNAIFAAALDALGFEVTRLGARVRWMSPPDAPLGPRTHMLLKVDLDGIAYLADVGFGACLLEAPLRLEIGAEQRTAMGTYRLTDGEGHYTLSAQRPDGWRAMYTFNLEPQLAADYELGNYFTSTHPQAPFPNVLIMERLLADQRLKLVNLRLIAEARDGRVVSERTIASAEDLADVLDQTFQITPPVPAAEIFARISG